MKHILVQIAIISFLSNILNSRPFFKSEEKQIWIYFSDSIKKFEDYNTSKGQEIRTKLWNYCN
jgi:hypothetical protein